MKTLRNLACCALGLLALQSTSFAVVMTSSPVEAFDNATVQPGGPRSGTSGKNFFNIEGSNNTTFSSFGVMDFTIAAVSLGAGEMISSVDTINLAMTQSNSGFTLTGGLAFYLTQDTSTSIQPGSSLTFNSGVTPGGFSTQLSPSYLIGTGTFTAASTGTTDTYSLSLSGADPAAQTYLSGFFTNGGTLRLVAVATDAFTAATYAGFSNSSGAGPTISAVYTTAVPEPSTYALLVGGAAFGFLAWRRKRVVLS